MREQQKCQPCNWKPQDRVRVAGESRSPSTRWSWRRTDRFAHRQAIRRTARFPHRRCERDVAGSGWRDGFGTMKKPRFQRCNPKARRVQEPPPGVDLAEVAESCRYVGSPCNKDAPGFAGVSRGRRPDASLCPRHLANEHGLVEDWLRDAVRAGQVGAWERGCPRYVWYRDGQTVYEARQGSPGSGEYHGDPLELAQAVRGLR